MQSLSLEQTEELHGDIEKYLTLEQSDINIDFWTVSLALYSLSPDVLTFWQNMMVVCKDALEKLRQQHDNKENTAAVVQNDIASILNGKSLEQLSQLQRQIQAKLASNEPIDVEYWEGLLKNLIVWKAKVRVVETDRRISSDTFFLGKA